MGRSKSCNLPHVLKLRLGISKEMLPVIFFLQTNTLVWKGNVATLKEKPQNRSESGHPRFLGMSGDLKHWSLYCIMHEHWLQKNCDNSTVYSPNCDNSTVYSPNSDNSTVYSPNCNNSTVYSPNCDNSTVYSPNSDNSLLFTLQSGNR